MEKHSIPTANLETYAVAPMLCRACGKPIAPGQEMRHVVTGATMHVACFAVKAFPVVRRIGQVRS